jgi:hypothetical protein
MLRVYAADTVVATTRDPWQRCPQYRGGMTENWRIRMCSPIGRHWIKLPQNRPSIHLRASPFSGHALKLVDVFVGRTLSGEFLTCDEF